MKPASPPLRAVIFDLGGVLLRTEDPAPREALARRLGLSRRALEDLVFNSPAGRQAQRGEISPEALWEHVRERLGLPPAQLPAVQHAFWEGDRLDAALVDFIRRLRPRFRTALLSNAWRDLRAQLPRWGLADAFDQVVVSAEEGVMKPDPRIYHVTLERLGVLPAEAVFVDDFPRNVEGARRLGMYAIHFRHREQALAELRRLLGEHNGLRRSRP